MILSSPYKTIDGHVYKVSCFRCKKELELYVPDTYDKSSIQCNFCHAHNDIYALISKGRITETVVKDVRTKERIFQNYNEVLSKGDIEDKLPKRMSMQEIGEKIAELKRSQEIINRTAEELMKKPLPPPGPKTRQLTPKKQKVKKQTLIHQLNIKMNIKHIMLLHIINFIYNEQLYDKIVQLIYEERKKFLIKD